MIILSHRGYWLHPHEKNSVTAFSRSFNLGFGTETDIRDYGSQLIISHDMPLGTEISLADFIALLSATKLPLALNIKADGLAHAVQQNMQAYDKSQWFVFDMSIPDMRAHLVCGNPVFARVSEVEPEPVFFDDISGIWLDAFYQDGWQLERINAWLENGKRVCLVSPELHGRKHQTFWQDLRQQHYWQHQSLMLCTDYPEEAKQFFGAI